MRTTKAWAAWRRTQYYAGFLAFFLVIAGWIYLDNFYEEPTCFDGSKNGGEEGIDCGGDCVRICPISVDSPNIKWSRSFKVTDGMYNAVAYIENTNREAATLELRYKFTIYDEAGLIATREGTTILPPNGEYPIFEGRIETGRRVPTRTFIELEDTEAVWRPSESGREKFTVVERALSSADSRPRLDATIRNENLEEVKEVEVVATIFDSSGNALATSRTFVDNFTARAETDVFFTWPEPIATTLRSCEIPTDVVLAIDVSGSMNSDQLDPPQPLTDVKEAAIRFVNRLNEEDQAGVITFATEAETTMTLGAASDAAAAIEGVTIDPEEESGYTNTGEGIQAAATEVASLRHNVDARKVLVLLTDGLATAPGDTEEAEAYALSAAESVKGEGVEVYAIGLGEKVNVEFVEALASTPSQAFRALDSADIESIYQDITASLCEEGAAIIDIVPKSDYGFVPLR